MKKENIEKIYDLTLKSFNNAEKSLRHSGIRVLTESLDVLPGYDSVKLEFGSFDMDTLAVLFIDIRNSTERAKHIDVKGTFLSMHTFFPAMIAAAKIYGGYVMDIMGDGLMVFFGGKKAEKKLTEIEAVKKAYHCGNDMIKILDSVVNEILISNDVLDIFSNVTGSIECGVGIDFGDVIVTKIGINGVYEVKAFGDCINNAAHLSDGINVNCSENVRRLLDL